MGASPTDAAIVAATTRAVAAQAAAVADGNRAAAYNLRGAVEGLRAVATAPTPFLRESAWSLWNSMYGAALDSECGRYERKHSRLTPIDTLTALAMLADHQANRVLN